MMRMMMMRRRMMMVNGDDIDANDHVDTSEM